MVNEFVAYTNGRQRMLASIIRIYGGATAIAATCNVHKQSLINWRKRGRVPLEMVNDVANALGINKWGLNYLGLKQVLDPPYPTWKAVVESYDFSKSVTDYILSVKY